MRKAHRLLNVLGPGFITGAADDDPSGIATYAQTGAQFGYGQLWTALFSTPFMAVIQEMNARIGIVTGRGLSSVIRSHYPRSILMGAVVLLLVANAVNIGADLGAMAEVGASLSGYPFALWLVVAAVGIVLLEVFVSYRAYARFLKYLCLSLLAYVAAAFIVVGDWDAIGRATLFPHIAFTKDTMINLVAILGTTISPYLFFWQADEEVEEAIARHASRGIRNGHRDGIAKDLRLMRWDTGIGMTFSNAIMFFIMVTAAAALHAHGITTVASAAEAAEALRPIAGDFAFLLFALGIVGTGLLAVPILAGSASYAVSEAFGWKVGLHRTLRQAHGFYGVIILATLLGLAVNWLPIPPFQMLYYTAVLNGIIAPPLMALILLIGGNRRIMGEHVNSRISAIAGWTLFVIMTVAAVALFVL